jgi:hypothetical protein
MACPTGGWSLLLLGAYPLWSGRILWRRRRERSEPFGHTFLYATFCMLAKFPQAAGMVRYLRHRLQRRQGTLIEYK